MLETLCARGGRSLQALATLPGVATPTPPAGLASAWTSIDDPETLAALERSLASVKGATRPA